MQQVRRSSPFGLRQDWASVGRVGSWELIRRLGRVPRRPIWDNQAGIGWRGRLAQGVGRVRGDVGDQGGAIAAG
jgi:hypothetical protein